jgi:UDP-N-acetyl-D-glucosamine/UDP-N-acetyl-D-galactosamine dehydrogenase
MNELIKKTKICVVGLGYVGLPLSVEFSRKYKVVGFDINLKRVKDLNEFTDNTFEVSNEKLKQVMLSKNQNIGLDITKDESKIKDCSIYIITVPTPVNKFNQPDFNPLIKASELVGKYLKTNDIVIYESTVYPGATEEVCLPILESISNKKLNKDFFIGYSPERINPGDKLHTLTKIVKVTSGSNKYSLKIIDDLYKSIIEAGTFPVSSIKIAEASKVIENTQRDINIAFVNELSKIFNLMNIDTKEVLEASSTKWNFLNFKPGLVGGHCIGVDPYYLAQKAQELGYHPEIILTGRRINDSMGAYVAQETIKLLIKNGFKVLKSRVLIMGFTFKENCPDYRNTRVIDIIDELKEYNISYDVYDPNVDKKLVEKEYAIKIQTTMPTIENYDAIILAVAHDEFKKIDLEKSNKIIFDVKGLLSKSKIIKRL